MFRRSRGSEDESSDQGPGADLPPPEVSEPAPAPPVSEADIALIAERLSGAVSGLQELIGKDQLDVRARITGVEERLGILEHLVGQLIAQQASSAPDPPPVGGKKLKRERRRALSQRPLSEARGRKKAAAEADPIAASMDRGHTQGMDAPEDPDSHE